MAILQRSKSRRYDQALLNCRVVSTRRQQKRQTTVREANGVLPKLFSSSTAIKLKYGMKSFELSTVRHLHIVCNGIERLEEGKLIVILLLGLFFGWITIFTSFFFSSMSHVTIPQIFPLCFPLLACEHKNQFFIISITAKTSILRDVVLLFSDVGLPKKSNFNLRNL